MSGSWNKYYENTDALEPSKFLVEALSSSGSVPGAALDLGAGAGRDTRYLLERGFSVTAVDNDPAAEQYLKRLPHQGKLEIVCVGFEAFEFGLYDVVNAHYALPFIEKHDFDSVMSRVTASINLGGLFIGQLFGVDDEWNNSSTTMTFFVKADIDRFFANFDFLDIREVNEIGRMANGSSKHWHVFNIIARK